MLSPQFCLHNRKQQNRVIRKCGRWSNDIMDEGIVINQNFPKNRNVPGNGANLMDGFYPAFKYPLDCSSGIVILPRVFLFLLLKLMFKLNQVTGWNCLFDCFDIQLRTNDWNKTNQNARNRVSKIRWRLLGFKSTKTSNVWMNDKWSRLFRL